MVQSSLDLNLTATSLTLSALAIFTALILAWVAMKRSGFSGAVIRLEVLRVLIIFLVIFLLHQPEWRSQYRPESKPQILVFHDQSPSMQTIDAFKDGDTGGNAISRSEAIEPLLQVDTWQTISSEYDLVISPISEHSLDDSSSGVQREEEQSIGAVAEQTDDASSPRRPKGLGLTDLDQPLRQAIDRREGLAGVVMISDGDWNEGPSPVDAAAKLRGLRIPVFTVVAGSRTKLPDLELVSADVPTFGAEGKTVRIPLTIDSSLPRESVVTMKLMVGEVEVASEEIRIAPMGRTFDAIQWTPQEVGDFVLTIDLPVLGEEKIDSNNRITLPISIRKEQLKVLIVESLPRWEYRYLRNALSRDPGVEVSCLLFHPGLEKVGGGSLDYLKVFPQELEDLSQYDVVFLGDVGLDDEQLTEEQCELIRGLVEYQASGLVFMPGFQGRQFSLLSTELVELYPVLLDEQQPEGWGSRLPGHFELTQRGRSSLLTKLADSSEENFSVWEGLPGFQWYAPVVRAKAGAEVLAVHQDMSNDSGRLPLLVTRPFGAGKVLFMGTDGAWRWRKGVEDKYHYRFWGQVVRWMAYQRNMAKGETMRLFYSPDQPNVRQTLSLSAHVMDSGGEPLQDGSVTALITSPSGALDTIRLTGEGERWGVFGGRFETSEPGKHEVVLSCKETNAILETSFFVQGQVNEPLGRPARPEVLEEISRVSRGRHVMPEQIDSLLDAISELPKPEPTTRTIQLWAHPVVAGALLLLLAVFWISRKVAGLI